MRGKWIDNTDYIGPDRRRVGDKRLFKERRKFDESGEPPSLPIMIRRLRVQLLGLSTQQEKTLLLQLARAAITQAEVQRKPRAADFIKEGAKMIQAAYTLDSRLIQAVDTKFVEALNYAH
jgi:hypothetical protein